MNPLQIERWLERNAYKLTNSVQYLGDEPNTLQRDWEGSSLRWLMVASWPYEHAAGNQSIPYVAKAVTDASASYLCDRFYLPATPRDMRLLERGGVPVFGIESKHQLSDFDVVGTSISYLVLFMNFMKMLSMSGIPLRWRDREARAGEYPMIIIGGQAYSAPGAMEPVADCIWLGEADTEPGNGGIAAVCARIEAFKANGLWRSNRILCYEKLALEFSYLHFPRFVQTSYWYEDRGLEHWSKQVSGYRSLLPGMVFPRRARKVRNMDKIAPLDKAPLLYADPALGAGDLEVARGSVDEGSFVLVRGEGLRRLSSWQGDALHPHDGDLGVLKADSGGRLADVSHVLCNGSREMVTVQTQIRHDLTCTPDHEISVVRGPAVDARHGSVSGRGAHAFLFSYGHQGSPSRLEELSCQPRVFVRADELIPGSDYIPVYYGQNVWAFSEQSLDTTGCFHRETRDIDLPSVLDEDVAWLLGMLAGDITLDNKDSSHTYALRIQTEDPGIAARTSQVLLRLFGRDVEPWTREGARAGRQTFVLQSGAVIRWLGSNFGITDNKSRRRVPEKILRSPRHVVASYLSGFFDSDGTYDDRTGRPSWCSSSEELIRVVGLLLLNLGAPCSVREIPGRVSGRGFSHGPVWKVQGQQAEDGDWSWLQPVHSRRLPHVLRWQEQFGRRRGREALDGVIYTPVTECLPAGTRLSYDLAVPEMSSFTCNGVLVHNCPAWCGFCRLSWLTKPYRQRSVQMSVDHAAVWCRNMGATETSPFAPDFPMYTERKTLIARLLTEVSDELDSVAMRVDDAIADGDYWLLSSLGGMDAVTLGLEGNCLHQDSRIQVPGVGLLSLWDMAADQRAPKTVKVGREDAELEGVSYSGQRQVWRVTLSDGSQLLATPEHLVKTLDGRPADQRIYLTPEQRRLQGTTSNYLSKRRQADALGEVWREVRDLRPGMVLRSYYGQMSWPEGPSGHMGEDMAWLLGLLSGDGRVTTAGIEIRCDDPGVQERSLAVLARYGVAARVREEEDRSPVVTAYRRELAALLAAFGVLDTDTKRHIPYYVWRSPREVVAAYLRGVLDADGCVPERAQKHGLTVVHGTHSEQFARDLGLLISAFGHPVSLHRNVNADGYVMWHTTIHSAPDADWGWLRFSETSRQRKLEAVLALAGSRTGQVQWRGGQDGMKYVTVRKIEPDVECARVYDLHVPGVVSFTANNVVVHNSQRMRDLVGKGISDREVEEAVTQAIRAGIRKIKLFMITNLPGEEPGDVMRIVRLAERLAAIRDSLGQPNVQIQFSWTPLLIEAGTPFQWFAPTPPDHTLREVADLFKGIKVAFKIGTKAEPNKLALFQLCQRASADVGEAIVDVLAHLDIACWGGVPRDMQERLDTALRARGFANGFDDCFDERSGADLFGWEYIDTGVSRDLLYRTYRQMVEFLENTDAATYDGLLGDAYRGQEFVARCDTQCMGNTCGVCSGEDLKLRSAYIEAGQREQVPDLSAVHPVDQSTVDQKVLVRMVVPPRFRFVDPDHWRFSLRRAAYQVADIMSARLPAGFSVAKRSIRLVADGLDDRGVRGVGYAEFGVTRELDELTLHSFLDGMAAVLSPWLGFRDGQVVAPQFSLKREMGAGLYSLDVRDDPDLILARLRVWESTPYVPAVFHKGSSYFNVDEEINARDCVDDMWLRSEGSSLTLRMLSRGPLGPYQLYATLMGQRSWIEAMAGTVEREDVYLASSTGPAAVQGDLLRPVCTGCGQARPQNMAGEDFHPDLCPRCLDGVTRRVLGGLSQPAGV
jgi:intein/homing endonuclease